MEQEKKLKIFTDLEKNITLMEKLYADCADVVKRRMAVGENHFPVYIIYMDTMINRDLVETDIFKSLIYSLGPVPARGALEYILDYGMITADVARETDLNKALKNMMSGDTLMFVDGADSVLVINSKGYPNRGVQAAESEITVHGPKDSFTESVRFNTVLVRRRIKDHRLKTVQIVKGTRSKTDIAIMYVEDLAQQDVLTELKSRMDAFEIDGIFDSGSLEQLLEKEWYSPFPQFQTTERPDKTASALLEGRVAVLADNSPQALLLPAVAGCFYQASDDYYNRWGIAAFTRMIRYIASVLAFILPGLYIAVAAFHPEVFPTSLALSFAASRQGVPFPLAVEVILMELAFEVLREAGIRLPGAMGGTLGIVGGLIIGQAAVDANIVSPIVVIIVALTALCAFTIPNEAFASAFRLVKFYLIFLSMFLGIFGFVLGVLTLLVHLASLDSFGVPYMMPFTASEVNGGSDRKDGIFRRPLRSMNRRPVFARPKSRRRLFFHSSKDQ
ncbi:MAG TPA: spore germination protein [Candidatus Scybalocola faecavium]|nr:spore germination protein [Candidatus Scybalocola faecavium]